MDKALEKFESDIAIAFRLAMLWKGLVFQVSLSIQILPLALQGVKLDWMGRRRNACLRRAYKPWIGPAHSWVKVCLA
ncbi:hypothetical protein P3L10_014124 [Capsicum annuum]